jgi:hypothetical protein
MNEAGETKNPATVLKSKIDYANKLYKKQNGDSINQLIAKQQNLKNFSLFVPNEQFSTAINSYSSKSTLELLQR